MGMEIFNQVIENAFCLGVQAGIQQMEDKIQNHCERGKPVMANGKLYFFKDSKQHLVDIMDSLDKELRRCQ